MIRSVIARPNVDCCNISLGSILNVMLGRRCAYKLVRFRYKSRLVRIKKRSCFGLTCSVATYSCWKLFWCLLKNIQCFYADKCLNVVSKNNVRQLIYLNSVDCVFVSLLRCRSQLPEWDISETETLLIYLVLLNVCVCVCVLFQLDMSGSESNTVLYFGLFEGKDPNPAKDPGYIIMSSFLVFYKWRRSVKLRNSNVGVFLFYWMYNQAKD